MDVAAHLATVDRVHFVGIGGAGNSGLARILRKRGFVVTGSDRGTSASLTGLEKEGIRVFPGHAAANVDFDRGLVVVSAAIPEDNPEVAAAKARGVPVVKYAVALAAAAAARRTIAIAGCHGKTTTTALTVFLLRRTGIDCGYLVGGRVPQLKGNADDGKAWEFVVEACEYDRSFLNFTPALAAVTNVDADHLDYYGNLDAIRDAFAAFVQRIRPEGLLVADAAAWNDLRPRVESSPDWAGKRVRVHTVGFDRASSLRIVPVPGTIKGARGVAHPAMRLYSGPDDLGAFQLAIPGVHNLENAAIAVALCLEAGAPLEALRKAVADFEGVDRRLTVKFQSPACTVLDDYGHHPVELRATLAAARQAHGGEGRRLVLVFQPHQYSRTRLLFDDFVDALSGADRVILTDIFAARDTDADRASVSSERLARELAARGVDAVYAGPLDAAADLVWSSMVPGDVVLTSGAGDVDRVADELVRRLARS